MKGVLDNVKVIKTFGENQDTLDTVEHLIAFEFEAESARFWHHSSNRVTKPQTARTESGRRSNIERDSNW